MLKHYPADDSLADPEGGCSLKADSSSLGNGLKMRIKRNGIQKMKPGSTSSSSSSANNSRAASPSGSSNSRMDSDVHDFILAATGSRKDGGDTENPLKNLLLKQQQANLKENGENSPEPSIFNGGEDERSNEASTMTEPDKLGPCEPGTAVRLQGIVWQETEKGLLVLNVTWKGKTYMGTLLDCNRQSEAHKWGPLSDPSAIKGRGSKRNRSARSRTPPVSGGSSSNGGGGGPKHQKKKSCEPGVLLAGAAVAPSKVKRKAALNALSGLKKKDPEDEDEEDLLSGDDFDDDENDLRDCLIECPKGNCSKKFRDLEALKFHLSFAHSDLKRPPPKKKEAAEGAAIHEQQPPVNSTTHEEGEKEEESSERLRRQGTLSTRSSSSNNESNAAYSDISDEEEPDNSRTAIPAAAEQPAPPTPTSSSSQNQETTPSRSHHHNVAPVSLVPTSNHHPANELNNGGRLLPPSPAAHHHPPPHLSTTSSSGHNNSPRASSNSHALSNSPFSSQAFRHFAMFGSPTGGGADFGPRNMHPSADSKQMDLLRFPHPLHHPHHHHGSPGPMDYQHHPNPFLSASSKLQELQEKAFSNSLHHHHSNNLQQQQHHIPPEPHNFLGAKRAPPGGPNMHQPPLQNYHQGLFSPRPPPVSPLLAAAVSAQNNILRHEHKHTHLHLPCKNEAMESSSSHYGGNNKS